jgi:hypothetical protein
LAQWKFIFLSENSGLSQIWLSQKISGREPCSTGVEAVPNIKTDLMMNALKVGEHRYKNFKEERLMNMPPLRKFHEPMKMCKLKTFSSMC